MQAADYLQDELAIKILIERITSDFLPEGSNDIILEEHRARVMQVMLQSV